jgi:hexosaminidase
LVAYAAARNITIVPEIEMPGHASAALASYPELAIDGRAPGQVPADWGVYENLYNVNEDTFSFLENVLTEVMALFPSRYIHVGGDEAAKAQWERSPSVHTTMFSLGISDTHALQSYVIDRISRFLEERGRRLIGWDEILDGGLAPNATIMSWHGVDGAVTAAQSGHDAVLTPWPILYFDNRQSPSPEEPPGRGRIVTANDIYLFDPAPASLTPDQQHHILGVEGAIWTEHIRTEDRVWRMSFPRGAAIAELGWAPAGARAPEDFARRLAAQERRYRELHIPAWSPPSEPPFNLNRRVSQELEPCSNKIVLNLEDDAPLKGPRARFLIDVEQPCWIWRGVFMPDVRAITAAIGQVPFNFQIGDDINRIHFRAPATAEGELEVRLGCDGERIAVLPLAPAAHNNAVTVLPSMPIAPISGVRDLCFTFTQASIDPMYAIDWIRLEGAH